MKRLFAWILAVSILTGCNQQDTPAEGEMVPPLPPAAKLEPFDDGSGVVRVTVYDAGGTVVEQGYYRNGYREGTYTTFGDKGIIKTITGYVHGKKEGQEVVINKNGQLEERYTYHNGQLDGPYIKFNRNRLKETRDYVNGKLHGKIEKFYPNGKVMERSYYVDGKMHGIARWYDREGNNTIAYEYKNGELVGEAELEAAPEPEANQ